MHVITGWVVHETKPVGKEGREVHVYPRVAFDNFNDQPKTHTMSAACWCQPDVEVYNNPLVIHRGFEN